MPLLRNFKATMFDIPTPQSYSQQGNLRHFVESSQEYAYKNWMDLKWLYVRGMIVEAENGRLCNTAKIFYQIIDDAETEECKHRFAGLVAWYLAKQFNNYSLVCDCTLMLHYDMRFKGNNIPLFETVFTRCARRGKDIVLAILLEKCLQYDKINHKRELKTFLTKSVILGLANPAFKSAIIFGLSDHINVVGFTPLHFAAIEGHVGAVHVLLNYLDKIGQTCFLPTSTCGEINLPLYHGWTPLHLAALAGHPDVVRVLLNNMRLNKLDLVSAKTGEENIHDCPDSMSYTALHCAVIGSTRNPQGCLEAARQLISFGAQINIGDRSDNKPLHWACKLNNLDMVQVLFENGDQIRKGNLPNIDIGNAHGNSAMHIACAAGHLEIVKYLHPTEEEKKRRELLGLNQRYADLSKRDQASSTPFHVAIENEHVEIVKYMALLRYQRFDQKNNDGNYKYKPEELARSLDTDKGREMETIIKQAILKKQAYR